MITTTIIRRGVAAAVLAFVAALAAAVGVNTPTPAASAECYLGFIGDTCIQQQQARTEAPETNTCWWFCGEPAPAPEPVYTTDPWVWEDFGRQDSGGGDSGGQGKDKNGKDCGTIFGAPIKQC